jgi:hypothetical protein
VLTVAVGFAVAAVYGWIALNIMGGDYRGWR